MLSLAKAASLAGTSKTSLTRAIKAGRLSATKREDGSYEIDPSELARVFTVTPVLGTVEGNAVQRVPPGSSPAVPPEPVMDPVVAALVKASDEKVAGLVALVEEIRASRDELRIDRDGWRERAERLLAAPPARPWWRRLAG
jgi:hypothetical protein